MKNDSPLFDRIRVKPDKDRRVHPQSPACDWPNCKAPATHRAPKGRLREREYWRFCLDHVRQYNQTYNFFSGMNPDDIAKYQKKALVKRHHPDANGGDRSSEDKLREIIQAYKYLKSIGFR